jgi:hypothetical protein
VRVLTVAFTVAVSFAMSFADQNGRQRRGSSETTDSCLDDRDKSRFDLNKD